MLEYLPWIIAGLVVGLFVGYAFGKYRGASEASEELDVEKGTAGMKAGRVVPPSAQADPDAAQMVYIRRGGTHYHKEGCHHLRRRTGQPMSKAEAVKKGFRSCPSCRP